MQKKKRHTRRTIILALLASAIFYTLYANFTKDDLSLAAVGDYAPDFILQDLDGNQYRLSDFKGKGVFLNFWGTYCKPCKDEMPFIDNQYQQYKDQGVEVLAVNVGETDLAIDKFVTQYDLSFPIVIDVNGEVQDAYGIYPLPATFLINAEGEIVYYTDKPMNEQMVKEYMEMIKP